jgi:hypothetical protein
MIYFANKGVPGKNVKQTTMASEQKDINIQNYKYLFNNNMI